MDLTARVSRALRSIDGAVVVVDAVEGCQIQTEIVTKQALNERIKPILFINKVDRLIKEIKLSLEEIEQQFKNIIYKFNDLIEMYAESPYKEIWKISPEKNNVGFGCALNPSWGFTLEMMIKQNLKFKDILTYYLDQNYSEKIRLLSKILPLDQCILNMIINYLPNPKFAQSYRIKKIWKGDLNSKIGKSIINCDETGPVFICIHKILFDKHVQKLSFGRIFSGTINVGDELFLVNSKTKNRLQQIYISKGHKKEIVNFLSAGNIGVFIGLSEATVGETLTNYEDSKDLIPFENIKYISQPVLTVSIEPKHPQELPKMLDILKKIKINDPDIRVDINETTGEYLISGIGQLHLEIIANEIEEYGVEILMSSPIVVYREGIEQESPLVTVKSRDKNNYIQIKLTPLKIEEFKNVINRPDVLSVDANNNAIINNLKNKDIEKNTKQMILKGINLALNAGPLCEEPIKGIQISINEIKISNAFIKTNPTELMLMSKKAIYSAFLKSNPTIYQPIYKIQVQVPSDLIGSITSILSQRKGKVINIEQKGSVSFITGLIPVKESFDLATIMRSSTAGRAFWQTIFSHWELIPFKIAKKTISDLRLKKGRPLQIPKPDFFNNN
ncbi:MAG: GTP-binding protein [Candidatus Helarchaeota archaeon]